jgi:hypothetical protein
MLYPVPGKKGQGVMRELEQSFRWEKATEYERKPFILPMSGMR